jgi:hypothetical protein
MGIMRDIDNINRTVSYMHARQTARNTRRIADALDPDGARRRGGMGTGTKAALWFLGISALFLAVVIALVGSSPPDVPDRIVPTLTPITTTSPPLPYSPNGCPADGHPWCSNPTATENPEGTLPYGPPRDDHPCLNNYDCPGYTPTTTPTCSPWVPNSTDLPPCDTLPTTLPPAVPPTLLPQQTVPGVPMVPPGGSLPTDPPGVRGHHGPCPPTNWCPDTPVPDEPLPPQPTVVF